MAWEGLSYILGKLFLLVSTIVLARILVPEDFGIVSLAMVFILYVEDLTDLGVAKALVYFPLDGKRTDGAFAITVMWSLILVAAAMIAAPAVANFFGRPEVTTMFRVLSLGLLLRGLTEVPDALLRKELRFRSKTVANLTQVFVQAVVSISLAVGGAGPWAIVWGYLAGSAAWSLVAWSFIEYRPSGDFWRPHKETVKPLLAYGLPVAGEVLLLAIVFNIDYLIVGHRLGAEALAFYALAFRIPQMVIINVLYVLGQVAFPVYSIARTDTAQLRAAYLGNVKIQTVYGVGAGVGLAVVAPMLVEVLFGAKWTPAVVPLEGLALYAAFRSVGTGAGDVLKGVGRPGLAVWLALLRLVVLLPALLFAVDHGIDAVAVAQAAVAFSLMLVIEGVAAHAVGVSMWDLLRSLVPALAVGAATFLGASAGRFLTPGPDAIGLLVGVVVGGAAGFAALYSVDRELVTGMWSLARNRPRPAVPQ